MFSSLFLLLACADVKALIVRIYPQEYEATEGASVDAAIGSFEGADAERPRMSIALAPVIEGLSAPTDVQFPPGRSDVAVVLQKGGEARVFSLADGGAREVGKPMLDLDVLTRSEQGLLGLAFHPDYGDNQLIYVNYSTSVDGKEISRVSEFKVAESATGWTASDERWVMQVVQPYANHDAGQLAFGPDGMLYIGWGDGGWRDDPEGHGQNPATLLGAMLRIDVDQRTGTKPYGIPGDNPFVDTEGTRPEIWATGLRNPWRYSFAPDGRLVVADVGQDTWEEVHIVAKGDNLGWSAREARHCFPAGSSCPAADADPFVDPVYEYPRTEGTSITGGFVYTGQALPELRGKYVFGDFVSGRLWAIELPATVSDTAPMAAVTALGRWKLLPSSFGQDAAGELYVADYGAGTVYRFAAP